MPWLPVCHHAQRQYLRLMKVNVLFDSQCFDMQLFGGVSRCFAELYSHLPADIAATIGVRGTHNVYLPPILERRYKAAHPWPGSGLWWRLCRSEAFWLHSWRTLNPAYSRRLVARGGFDVFHPTYFDPYFLPLLGDRPFVVTIHDMIPERLPALFPGAAEECAAKRLMAHRAARIIAVSEATRDDVIELLGVPPERVSVIYHGTSASDNPPMAGRPIEAPYLLYVGARDAYKRFREFVAAAVPVLRGQPSLKILCTGSRFSPSELAYFDDLGVADRMVHRFMETDEALLGCHRHAVAFVYPSGIEGFGIPILEAYRAGCPVMLADTKCFREVAGDAAIYFDPTLPPAAPAGFATAFDRLMALGADGRQALLECQRARLARYDWQRSAQQLAGIYHEVAGK